MTNPAADRFFASFTSSTDSPTAAWAGNPFQVSKLVNPHAQRDADFEIELLLAAGVVVDEVIELRPIAEDTEDDLGREAGVARIEVGGVSEKKFGCPGATFDTAKDFEGDTGGEGSPFECSRGAGEPACSSRFQFAIGRRPVK